MIKTSIFSVLLEYSISIISPIFSCFAGFAGIPLTKTLPISETVFATVLRYMQLMPKTFILAHDATIASGTVDMPTASAPNVLAILISAGVS